MSCPFCGRDPYEYVDIGVGFQPVAVTCCDLGIAYFDRRDENQHTITIDRDDFDWLARTMSALRQLGLDPQRER